MSRDTTVDGGDMASFRAMALTAPGINISNTSVRLHKGKKTCKQTLRKTNEVKAVGYPDCIGVFPLHLGLNVLTNLRIYVSTKEKVIYISRADAH